MYGRSSPRQTPSSPHQHSPRASSIRQLLQPTPEHQPWSHSRPPHHVAHSPSSPSAVHDHSMNGYDPHRHDKAPGTYYDPTSEYRERRPSLSGPSYNSQSPQVHHKPPSYASPRSSERLLYESSQTSPASTYHSHHSPVAIPPPSRGHPTMYSEQHPPQSPTQHRSMMMPPPPAAPSDSRPPTAIESRPPTLSSRAKDPMSFSNILSSSEPERPPPPPPPPPAPASHPAPLQPAPPQVPANHSREPSNQNLDQRPALEDDRPVIEPPPTSSNHHNSIQRETDARVNGITKPQNTETALKSPSASGQRLHFRVTSADKTRLNGESEPLGPGASRANRARIPAISDKDYQIALAKIESADQSDLDDPEFDTARNEYNKRTLKRLHQLRDIEATKRKRRRVAQITKLADNFGRQALNAKDHYKDKYEASAWQRITTQEQADEKERKKVMQRNRRRETTKNKAEAQAAELAMKAEKATDPEEKHKLMREAQRFSKKATATSKLLSGDAPNKDFRETTPITPNQSGGIMSSFQVGDEASQEPPKKRPRTGGRLKKSKEQKQAEKDAAAAAHAAIERGDELVPIAPKTDTAKEPPKKITLVSKDPEAAERPSASSKAYDQLYEQIWRDIARKDIPKVVRMKDSSLSTKQSNLRKTAQLASKEARRWQLKTNKSTKDIQARAKRVMREMLSFWKRNEREERDQRKFAEKQELENAKKAEAEREANRQKRKLNFLISQTELYSHFIGKKVKTAEAEKGTEDVAVSNTTIVPGPADAPTIDLPNPTGKPGTKVTNFEDLDFDADDDTALREAAMASAQNAVAEAQERAKNFNAIEGMQAQFDDEGEMNFQNPTSLQNMDIGQPKMLTCQLKEYQLKGLNWLVNLYEQGINGILADEMGLGKTIQSIAVMAYLAEMHNIWGPFLVIAPSSTLHNWQQEIKRFVPDLTVLPYWGNAKDRKVLRKFWDRKHITYRKDSPFHVMVTSYQLVVQDAQYFQKIRWQYMVLDEAQAIKSSQSSRWKSLLGFHCRNRLLLTGTPIQNNMQELWALLHFIMPSLFDSHDEFSDWFSKDIESHAQSNTKLNEDQLKRLHMILKPFMLRRIKKHVQKELGDKIEEDVFCDLTYRQRAYYGNLRNKISVMDLIEKATVGDDQDTATLMNLVMQFRKVCNHPDLFERAETISPVQFAYFAETASFLREGHNIDVLYSVRNLIEYRVPRLIGRNGGRLNVPGPDNESAGWRGQYLYHMMNIWTGQNILESSQNDGAFSFLRFVDASAGEVASTARKDIAQRAIDIRAKSVELATSGVFEEDGSYETSTPAERLFKIVDNNRTLSSTKNLGGGKMHDLLNISATAFEKEGLHAIEPCRRPATSAPPIELYCASQGVINEKRHTFFNVPIRKALFGISEKTEAAFLDSKLDPTWYPVSHMLPSPISEKARYTKIEVPSMRRFVTDSGKLARLDRLLGELKAGGHRVLIYFQMTRMIDLMEEYLAYRNYKYCRLDGSTKLEDRRDTVAEFQSNPEIFVFLLSTRAGGLGINLTAADTVIFYDSDWNPTIDSQAMDRAHRLGQTKQVTVYRMITRSTIEERIRRRALQKEEVQRVVIQGGAGAHVDFNTRSRENRTKDIAMWLADDDQAAEIEKKEAEIAEKEAKEPNKAKKKAGGRKKTELSLDDMYHEGEGHFEDSGKPSGTATPIGGDSAPWARGNSKRKGVSKKAKSVKEKLAIVDGGV